MEDQSNAGFQYSKVVPSLHLIIWMSMANRCQLNLSSDVILDQMMMEKKRKRRKGMCRLNLRIIKSISQPWLKPTKRQTLEALQQESISKERRTGQILSEVEAQGQTHLKLLKSSNSSQESKSNNKFHKLKIESSREWCNNFKKEIGYRRRKLRAWLNITLILLSNIKRTEI